MMKSLPFSAHHTPPLLPAPRLRRLLRLCASSASASASATPRADRLVPLSSAARPCRGLAAVSLSRGAAGRRLPSVSSSTSPPGPVQKSEEEWQAILTPEQFNILRLKGTERRKLSLVRARTDGSGSGSAAAEASTVGDNLEGEESGGGELVASAGSSAGKQPPPVNPKIEKELKKAVQKTVATFAPRASMKTKNPAVPGSALYTVFEVQGYVSMLLGGALSFNLVFPSNEPE